jgi:hypothetical protein
MIAAVAYFCFTPPLSSDTKTGKRHHLSARLSWQQSLPLSEIATKAEITSFLPTHAGRQLVSLAALGVGQRLIVPTGHEDQRGELPHSAAPYAPVKVSRKFPP